MHDKVKKKEAPYTQVLNDVLNSKDISFKAKGLFAYMCSKKNDWHFTIKGIMAQTKDGQNSITTAMDELKKFGYVVYTKHPDGSGTYNLFENPKLENPNMVMPNLENPNVENPNLGKSNPISNNIYISNTKESNKEELLFSDSDFLNKQPKKTNKKEVSPQIFFRESQWSKYENLRNKLKDDEDFKKNYAGVDLRAYIDDMMAWSEKGNKTTDLGWYMSIRKWIRDAKNKGVMHTISTTKKDDNAFFNQ